MRIEVEDGTLTTSDIEQLRMLLNGFFNTDLITDIWLEGKKVVFREG